jgi:hypothetical protein
MPTYHFVLADSCSYAADELLHHMTKQVVNGYPFSTRFIELKTPKGNYMKAFHVQDSKNKPLSFEKIMNNLYHEWESFLTYNTIVDKSRNAADTKCGLSLEDYLEPYILCADGRTYNRDTIEKAITNTLMNDEYLNLQDKTLTFRDVEQNKVILYPNLSLWPSPGPHSVPLAIEFKSVDIKFNRYNRNKIVLADLLSHQLRNDEGEDNRGTHFDYPTFVDVYKKYHEPDVTFDETKAIIKNVEIIEAPLFKHHGKSSKGDAVFYNAKLTQCTITGCICGVQFTSCLFYKCKFDLKKLNHFNCKNCDFIECEFIGESKDTTCSLLFNSISEISDDDFREKINRCLRDRPRVENCRLCLTMI